MAIAITGRKYHARGGGNDVQGGGNDDTAKMMPGKNHVPGDGNDDTTSMFKVEAMMTSKSM